MSPARAGAHQRMSDLDLQICWHRQFDPAVPLAKNLPTRKEEKIPILWAAVQCYQKREAQPPASNAHRLGANTPDYADSKPETDSEGPKNDI